jgi:hypothetical protein
MPDRHLFHKEGYEGMKPYWKAYFSIRGNIREGISQHAEIEAFGKQYGQGKDYRYLRNLASEFETTAQVA